MLESMRPPFPGMDPWLEHPARWPGVHNALIASMSRSLAPRLPEPYFIALEERMTISAPGEDDDQRLPDLAVATSAPPKRRRARGGGGVAVVVAEAAPGAEVFRVRVPISDSVRETYLEIRDAGRGGKLLTSIELLSPTNKRSGPDRRRYERKRARVLRSGTSLVEIDLLRGWSPMPLVDMEDARSAGYRILVSRGWERPEAQLYVFGVRAPIPAFPVPLTSREPEPQLELNPLLHEVYELYRYHLRIDYGRPAVPPLSEADAAWARGIVGR